MDGKMIVEAWRRWLDSEEGRKASNPETLGRTVSARQYLENRLNNAFQAGIKAAENVPLLDLNRRNSTREDHQ